jgi:hypothetical protein
MGHGIPAIFVIPAMIAIFLITSYSKSKAVLWTTLAFVVAFTLFVAFASAGSGQFGPLLAVGGFIGAAAITYLVRSRGKKR